MSHLDVEYARFFNHQLGENNNGFKRYDWSKST